MNDILNFPVATDGAAKAAGVPVQTADGEALFAACFAVHPALGADHSDAAQLRPAPLWIDLGQDGWLHQRPIRAALPTAMVRFLRLVRVMRDPGKGGCVRDGKGLLDGVMQRGLIPFRGDNIVGVALHNRLRRPHLAVECIHRDDAAGQGQFVQERGYGGDLVRFWVHLLLAQDEPVGAGPRGDHLHRRLAPRLGSRFAQGLAVHGHQVAVGGRVDRCEPGQEARLQFGRFEVGQHPIEGVVRGDAVRQGQDRAQPVLLRLAKGHHAGWSFRAAEHGTNRDRQNVQQLVIPGPLNAWVSQVAKMGGDARQVSVRHRVTLLQAVVPPSRIPGQGHAGKRASYRIVMPLIRHHDADLDAMALPIRMRNF